MSARLRILHLEDDRDDSALVSETLVAAGWNVEVIRVQTRSDYEAALATRRHDIVLADLRLPGFDGLTALALHQDAQHPAPFIFLSGHADEAALVRSLEQGAADLLSKQHLARLPHALRRVLHESKQRAQLRRTTEGLHRLSRRLLDIQETERRQIARELHDEVGQALTATKISLQTLARSPEPDRIASDLPAVIALVDRLVGIVRSLSLDLRPPLLDELGLVPAVRWLVEKQTQATGLEISFRAEDTPDRLDPALAITCFRIVQEALTNATRHAQAHSVEIGLTRSGDQLKLRIRDDGRGFSPAQAFARADRGGSLGLISMQERASLLSGTCVIDSALGHGTEIRATFPLTPPVAP